MIEIVDLRKDFNGHWVTKGVNLTIPDHQMTCIVGRSGEGKSVLLKQIVGLIRPTSGSIIVNGKDITKISDEELEIVFKTFGYVFQFAALLDSLNVFENIGITLLEQGIKPEQVLPIVKEKLSLVNLSQDVLYKYPSELSGGMKKRVGLARTLVTKPQIILYDEPTTGLDPITARLIHELMYDMQQRLSITSVVISHDVEIFKYADNVALLHDGQIRYFGSAKTVWESDNPYIYQFIRGLSEGPMQTEVPATDH
ncbi:MAG: ABC transporter ATP-binding protein YtrE [Candidatus Dependentiae bacterium ADurb.Bin331]|nr:MAG: ABC transporter ATP-binding protein YtrE [Candidatus Dependentiae bacterium ADurb.Bin331]